MKKTLIVGNWKMNLNVSESSLLLHRLTERIRIHRDIEVVLAPGFLALQPLAIQLDRRKFRLAAQNAYFADEGAYTGEVSFNMLRDMVHFVIVGHSERRYKFGEGSDIVRDKMAAAVRNDLTPILCVGETAQERRDKETMQVLKDEVTSALANLTAEDVEDLVIAYEPIWALSNGKDYTHHEIPTPDIIGKSVNTIRSCIRQLYGNKTAENIRILYGGSASSSTASGLLGTDGVDGLLVGGASLNYHEFSGIVEAAYRNNHKVDTNG